MLQQKIEDIQQLLKNQNAGALLVGNFGHQISDDLLYYLLLTTLEYGMLFIPIKGKPILWAICFEVPQYQKKYPEIEVRNFSENIQDLLKEESLGILSLAIRPSALPIIQRLKLDSIENVTIIDLNGEKNIFARKLPEECERLKKAAKITDQIFNQLIDRWPNFYTEADAAHFILKEIAKRGLTPSFSPIIASGANASNPHHYPTFKKIQEGFCVIDMGVRFKGYCSDMTRTIFIGDPSEGEQELYKKLLDAQTETIQQIHVGMEIYNLDKFCREKLGTQLNALFIHSLGHGVGSQVHEWPSVNSKTEDKLEENMVITIEPGVYKQGEYGIRIEDDVIIKKNGAIALNQTTKELITIA